MKQPKLQKYETDNPSVEIYETKLLFHEVTELIERLGTPWLYFLRYIRFPDLWMAFLEPEHITLGLCQFFEKNNVINERVVQMVIRAKNSECLDFCLSNFMISTISLAEFCKSPFYYNNLYAMLYKIANVTFEDEEMALFFKTFRLKPLPVMLETIIEHDCDMILQAIKPIFANNLVSYIPFLLQNIVKYDAAKCLRVLFLFEKMDAKKIFKMAIESHKKNIFNFLSCDNYMDLQANMTVEQRFYCGSVSRATCIKSLEFPIKFNMFNILAEYMLQYHILNFTWIKSVDMLIYLQKYGYFISFSDSEVQLINTMYIYEGIPFEILCHISEIPKIPGALDTSIQFREYLSKQTNISQTLLNQLMVIGISNLHKEGQISKFILGYRQVDVIDYFRKNQHLCNIEGICITELTKRYILEFFRKRKAINLDHLVDTTRLHAENSLIEAYGRYLLENNFFGFKILR